MAMAALKAANLKGDMTDAGNLWARLPVVVRDDITARFNVVK